MAASRDARSAKRKPSSAGRRAAANSRRSTGGLAIVVKIEQRPLPAGLARDGIEIVDGDAAPDCLHLRAPPGPRSSSCAQRKIGDCASVAHSRPAADATCRCRRGPCTNSMRRCAASAAAPPASAAAVWSPRAESSRRRRDPADGRRAAAAHRQLRSSAGDLHAGATHETRHVVDAAATVVTSTTTASASSTSRGGNPLALARMTASR